MNVPQYAAMQVRRRELIARIEALPPIDREHAESKDWSPLALLEHMNTVDGLTLTEAEIKPGRGTRNPILRFLIGRSRRGKTMPAPAMLVPKGGKDYSSLVTESEANHRKLLDLVNRATEADVITRHPFLGPLTATQACDLLDAHYEYHLGRFVEPKAQRG